MAPEVERASLDMTGWGNAGSMPDGPVELWLAVFADDGHFMGAAQMVTQPAWLWRNGALSLAYGRVVVTVRHGGRYQQGLICVVSREARAWHPMWAVSLGVPQELRENDTITVLDGVISLRPDAPMERPGALPRGRA